MVVETNKTSDQLKMNTVGVAEQEARQRLGPNARPIGFERYGYMSELEDNMPLMNVDGGFNGNPQRFEPVGPLEEDFKPVSTGHKKVRAPQSPTKLGGGKKH